ncbi:stearoyl-CoA desaturase (delta-9 desaturase) [Lysobacter sp. yr284]|uniref:acyl-CoA desaturase n=2 Tax=Lysobacter TaxID=68 RepID=UPI00089A83DE|nr:stearoyl-CoA desaturase (delta-9 desaturase) [Lysobacter sp. yr284]
MNALPVNARPVVAPANRASAQAMPATPALPDALPASLGAHRVRSRARPADSVRSVSDGLVAWEPVRSLWFTAMAAGAVVGGALTFSWGAFALFVVSTAAVLLLGHSLGMHRKLIHDSFECPKWLEYLLVYCGVQVGLAGPLALVRTHDLRDYAQRLPHCHDYLAHRRGFLRDAWWQLHCELRLRAPPKIEIESRIADDRVYRFLQRTWMWQHLPWALGFYALGGWGWVFWGVCARVTAGVFGHWLVGYFAHNHGGMHHEVRGAAVQGRNVRFASLLTMGECWHNNHHAFPGSARLGLYPGEWDPGWWLLRALERVGLVRGLRLPEDLPPREELQCLDAAPPTRAEHTRAPAQTWVSQ